MTPAKASEAAAGSHASGDQVVLVALACLVGLGSGLVAALFRRALETADRYRFELLQWGHRQAALGPFIVTLVIVACVTAAAWLVHRIEPHAEGSGIPRVEAVVLGRMSPGRALILPVKFLGGLLAIGSGLALGREGPSVQMGGNVGVIVARVFRRRIEELRILVAAGAAAGLTTAFTAPIAGAVFILEELVKRFDHRTALAALVASGTGFAAAHVILGPGTDFNIVHVRDPLLSQIPVVALVGLATGLLGVAYNRVIMGFLRLMDGSKVHVLIRAAAIGLVISAAAWYAPDLVGGGGHLTQRALLGHGTVLAVSVLLAARFFLGAVSYAAATPGGLFAPTLVLGSNLGLLVGLVCQRYAPAWTPEPQALALIGMASLFAATVRAPVTGIVLATEMTGSATLLPPMLGACAIAMLVAVICRCDPIYDQLTERSVVMSKANAPTSD